MLTFSLTCQILEDTYHTLQCETDGKQRTFQTSEIITQLSKKLMQNLVYLFVIQQTNLPGLSRPPVTISLMSDPFMCARLIVSKVTSDQKMRRCSWWKSTAMAL